MAEAFPIKIEAIYEIVPSPSADDGDCNICENIIDIGDGWRLRVVPQRSNIQPIFMNAFWCSRCAELIRKEMNSLGPDGSDG